MENEDIVYEEDKGAELVKKLRGKLKECEEEKKEYLDGWQRQKADAVNTKKAHAEALQDMRKRAVADFMHTLLPSLDSFDIALKGEAWEKVDDVWRTGIEHVRTQLLASLEQEGITAYGEAGEAFDPNLHEAVAHESDGESNTIARVERRGYKMGETVIRPAQVVVYE